MSLYYKGKCFVLAVSNKTWLMYIISLSKKFYWRDYCEDNENK